MTPEHSRSSPANAGATSAMAAQHPARFGIAISRALGTVVVTVHGDLDLPGAGHLGRVLADIIEGQGNLDVVVDLHDARAANASGLSMFAAAAEQAAQRGAALSLSDPPALLYQGLALVGLGRLVRTTRHDGRRPPAAALFGRRTATRERSLHPAGQSRAGTSSP